MKSLLKRRCRNPGPVKAKGSQLVLGIDSEPEEGGKK
jgi:hypothetical protein